MDGSFDLPINPDEDREEGMLSEALHLPLCLDLSHGKSKLHYGQSAEIRILGEGLGVLARAHVADAGSSESDHRGTPNRSHARSEREYRQAILLRENHQLRRPQALGRVEVSVGVKIGGNNAKGLMLDSCQCFLKGHGRELPGGRVKFLGKTRCQSEAHGRITNYLGRLT